MKIPEDVKKLSQRWERSKPSKNQEKHPCEYCGQTGTHPAGKDCPAYGKKCSKCKRLNHFAAVCRAGSKDKNHKTKPKQPKNKELKKQKETETRLVVLEQ